MKIQWTFNPLISQEIPLPQVHSQLLIADLIHSWLLVPIQAKNWRALNLTYAASLQWFSSYFPLSELPFLNFSTFQLLYFPTTTGSVSWMLTSFLLFLYRTFSCSSNLKVFTIWNIHSFSSLTSVPSTLFPFSAELPLFGFLFTH